MNLPKVLTNEVTETAIQSIIDLRKILDESVRDSIIPSQFNDLYQKQYALSLCLTLLYYILGENTKETKLTANLEQKGVEQYGNENLQP